ncbi:MAG: DNA primase [Syntrophobacteraceae bacterium]|nr:DNA primase [Desulfobacteraceae bacterium]
MNASDVATLVKQAVDIVDVIGQVVPLRRAGNRHVGLCPFHREKTASFQVDAENQLYYCFGCGSGGDVLSFVMKYQNLPFGDALRYLADRYNISLPEREHGGGTSSRVAEEARKERERLHTVLEAASDYFYRQLHQGTGRPAREYISLRGLPERVVETERLGYASPAWDGLCRHFERSGIDPEIGVKAGLLAVSTRDSGRFYDRFRNRLIFPIRDERGRVVAFGGRSLSSESQDEPKYLNSPETAVFRKGRMLYQMGRAREACRQNRQVLLVEGYMDLLAFHAHEFYRVVATLGTALAANQVRLMARMADEVILAYDGDDAGERAMLRALPIFLQEELPVSCLRFPDGMDPDDFLKKRGLAELESLVRERQDLGMYAVRKNLDAWDGSAVGKGKVLADLQPVLTAVRQPVLVSEYMRLVSDRLSLSEKVIQNQLSHGQKPEGRSYGQSRQAPVLPRLQETQSLEERILRAMVHYPELIEEVKTSGAVSCFQEPALKAIADVLLRVAYPPYGEFQASAAYDLLEDSGEKEIFTRLMLESGDLSGARIQVQDWLRALIARSAKTETQDLNEALRRASQTGDQAQVQDILARIQTLRKAGQRVRDREDNVQGVKNR